MDNESITVTIERITFANEQNGYHVLKASGRDYPNGVTLVGNFCMIQPGEEIKAYGIWACHPTFGMQFQTSRYAVLKPATLKGIEKFLGSGLIKGIGPVTAKRLVNAFGIDTLDIIENHPEKLAECSGIGPSKADKISQGFFLHRSIQDIMVFLQGHGISTAYAARIFKRYDKEAIKKVSENPYILADEIPGIGFKKADEIASEFGISGNDSRRVAAGILYSLNSVNKEGHLFLTLDELLKLSEETLEINDSKMISDGLNSLISQKKIISRDYNGKKLYYLPINYYSESKSVIYIKRLACSQRNVSREQLLSVMDKAIVAHGLNLSDVQQLAVETSLTKGFLIITGGPGTGKTTTLKAVIMAHKYMGHKVLLASPTGRAAKRLTEVSGFNASTIHRLLEYDHQTHGFKHNSMNTLDCDVLIIDEASMVDMNLFHSLIQAVPVGASIVLVGDIDQLPSVGAGLVLNELINSGVIPTITLDRIFRQAESSQIIKNAHRINNGEMPELTVPDGHTATDCYFIQAEQVDKVISLLKNVVAKSLPKKFGYYPITDIQVLTPMNRGPLGAIALNGILQEILNPPAPNKNEINHANRIFRVGDKVIQLRNNYELDVFNGDIGTITDISIEDQEITIDFPQGTVLFQPADFVDLAHAYAITVHKSQGSEYPAVVMITHTQHYMMLQRNLIYTGLTRAKKTMVFLGSKKAISIAVNNNKIKKRNTILSELLKG
ncbi:MAG: ATP-dependent RecD-like DNA helicase [Candidatus Riflebacteria bacterium]|nr:ATP-dependent RecD-like DNA helicase [Candidatus Riflebacteria bacterium]